MGLRVRRADAIAGERNAFKESARQRSLWPASAAGAAAQADGGGTPVPRQQDRCAGIGIRAQAVSCRASGL